ncbi:MAG: cytochrome c [Rhizobiaceae bacterium]
MKKLVFIGVILAAVGVVVGLILSAPKPLSNAFLSKLPEGNVASGEQVFWAGGCTSCHAAPKSKGVEKLVLSGGLELKTPFGIFRTPNISPHELQGIGGWSLGDFANAMKRGLRPDGAHYYPAFPYTTYTKMADKDVADLWAYMKTLPKSSKQVGDHSISFPFNIRRGLGLWKFLYLSSDPVLSVDETDKPLLRGRYLVEALAHCGECHTPRNSIGGMDKTRWLAGGVGPEGKEKIPNITPHKDGLGDWSVADIINGLETGFTPEYDSFGSSMADVQENMAKLSDGDRAAIAAYLKIVPPIKGKP